jgi:hypothetical protein
VDSLEVPDRYQNPISCLPPPKRGGGGQTLRRLRILLVQKPAAIVLVKNGAETPRAVRKRLDILDLDYQGIAGLGTGNVEGSGQVVHPREIAVLDVVRAVVVANLPAGPVEAFDVDGFAWCDGGGAGDCGRALEALDHPEKKRGLFTVRVPSVVEAILFAGGSVEGDLQCCADGSGSHFVSDR